MRVPTVGLDAVSNAEQSRSSDGLDPATIFEILGNERRRASLQRLADHETDLTVSELGREVAQTVTDKSTESDAVYDSVYISLCQTHLPKLDAVGLIEYDREQKRVARGPRFAAVRRQFQAAQPAPTDEASTARIGAAVSALTVVVGALAVVGPPTARTVLLFGLLGLHLLALASGVTRSYYR